MLSKVEPPRQLVRLRGRSYVAFVFSPVVPIVGWLEEIDATLARSPGFFVGRPVVLDLSAVDLSQPAITHLISALEARNIRVLGIEGVAASELNPGLPPLLTGGRQCVLELHEPKKPEAMAGVNGNSAARIYCQKIEAELLAIDGYYQTAEDIDATLRNRPAQAWLEGDIMKITPLN